MSQSIEVRKKSDPCQWKTLDKLVTVVLFLHHHHHHGSHRSGNKWSGEKKIFQGQRNVREFYCGSTKIDILKKSQGKLKL